MPMYEYRCENCGKRFELIQKFSDAPLTMHAECGGGPVERLISAPNFQFKGTGWYVTDYGKNNGSGNKKDDGKSESKSDSNSESKSEGKSESKSESKSETKSGGDSAPSPSKADAAPSTAAPAPSAAKDSASK